MSGILAGVAWVANQPDWTISKPSQIRIEGNNYLTDATIRSMLGISYPQSIMSLSPAELTAKLLERGSISSVRIDRGLLPPHVLVQIEDSLPVALVMKDERDAAQLVVDERGLQLPISSYRPIVRQSLPKLRFRPPARGTCPNWRHLYRAAQGSPVAVGTIDCRNPQNVFLQTDVGKVRLGRPGNELQLKAQIQKLDRLRYWWQEHPHPEQAEYLDLENPATPVVQDRF
jgi:cell division protein FtsQ